MSYDESNVLICLIVKQYKKVGSKGLESILCLESVLKVVFRTCFD
jgi:hypothetical protein